MRLARRPAYTLLEVILAAGLGAVLMGALYYAVRVQLHSSKVGRDKVEQSVLARSLLNSIANDISPNLGPLSPTNFRASSSQQGGGAAGGGASGGGASSG